MAPFRIATAGVLAVTAVMLAVTASSSDNMRIDAQSTSAARSVERLGAVPQLQSSDRNLSLQSTRPQGPENGQSTTAPIVNTDQKVTPHAVTNSSGCAVAVGGTMQPTCAVGPHVVIPPH